MANSTSSEKWTRADLLAYCVLWKLELEGGVDYNYFEKIDKMTYAELNREADWLWELTGK